MHLSIRHKLLGVGASVLLNGGALLAAAHVFSVPTPVSDPEIIMEVSLEPYFLSENVARESEAPSGAPSESPAKATVATPQAAPQPVPLPQPEVPETPSPPAATPSPVRQAVAQSSAPAAPSKAPAQVATQVAIQGHAAASERAAAGPPAPTTGKSGRNHSVAYSALVRRHLEMFKDYPRTAKRKREEGVVTVTFVINRQGRVLSVKVAKSSGHAALDQAAIDMVRAAAPLPAPPSDIGGEQIEMTVPAEFFLMK